MQKPIHTAFVIFLFAFLFLYRLSAQNNFYLINSITPEKIQEEDKPYIDSVLALYHKTKDDTLRMHFLGMITENINDDNIWPLYNTLLLEQSEKYSRLSSGIKKITCLKYHANAINNVGYMHFFNGDNEKAVESYKKALAIQEECKDTFGIANTLSNAGYSYWKKGNIEEALEYYNRSLKILETINEKPTAARVLNNIALVYRQQDETEKALEYSEKCLLIFEEIKDERSASSTLNNIGYLYCWNLRNFPKALEYYEKSLAIRERLNDKIGIGISLNNIGQVYEQQNNFTKALECFQKALAVRKEANDKDGTATITYSIGNLYYKQNDDQKALEYGKQSLLLSQELGFPENIKFASSLLSNIYTRLGKWKEALEMHKLSVLMRDSISNEETRKSTFKQQTKYEFEKKEALKEAEHQKVLALAEEEKKRQRLVLFGTAIGLLVVIAFAVFVVNRLKITRRQKKIIEQEQEKSEKLLLNILPKDTAQELKITGKAKPKYFEQVTVMFTDFKGFTAIAEKLSAEELVNELDFIFRKFDEIISKYPIEKIKTIGDAYMCAGGLPSPNTSNPMDVVNAAVEIQQWMLEQNNKWILRIGIHTGPVTAGVVGDKKFAYDIWGDAVNVASRMESSGEPGKINISGATYNLISHISYLNTVFRGKIPAKNKGEIEMYFVESNEIIRK